MEEKFLKGGSNIALSKNERTYFFRMFDAKLDATKIKERYAWQAYKKLDDKEQDKKDYVLVTEYIKNTGEKFVDALSSHLSTTPRSKEEHEELDDLNNKFSERLDKLEKKKEDTMTEGPTSAEKEDKINDNKKRVVATQGRRDDSDSE
ncbi:hypothetical protein RhiirA5_429074 [Rhizophagus irregularis]|uniref:Uncharacterized protein n=2 Tax=Rhizophagus irregularis TaxID=588596 RepID=U9TKS6_RHIID|nr:hypothetical protein GLOIN_2v1785521 [Rhizophagus irregularis DAOM 181602=DAOM 197198]PKB99843.1 hypothetical protein RhiirA5_429074 [Rhizophagus irregularis]PKC68480.1 hypothetical protein RhiirA1_392868 [Rhizophagus irregularis]PKY15251.1 hypothetical protein RhiirB3_427416 [Rhizophagus irregularis]POG62252.1 hypothetical protein GLOIN_2v1785521 [Rhizophagus irregularis DAOM 181602=DAOM 197198]UZO28807.1 hypothetical protein OCT59_022318 [Rhizophagus irregularis]|eukprot:XP_025169118.1 hypothetical protein GLOIN_2v1785521 [Rhizophagus irregularis DAOM 181602=DAOM 197198]